MNKKFITRPLNDSDLPFIFSTWLRGLFYGNDWFQKIEKTSFFSKYKLVIEHLLSNSTTTICCLEEDPEVILGYVVYDKHKLHWVYVKRHWRRLGIGKALVPLNIDTVTHLTKSAAKRKPKNWAFDPLLT